MVGWPADEATGPIQTLIELSDSLKDDFELKFIARDLPFHSQAKEYRSGWAKRGPHQIYWCRMGRFWPRGFRALLNATPHDILTLNSIFDREFTIPALLLRRFGLIPRKPTLLSPRGEMSDGALSIKSWRKRIYLTLARLLGLYSDVWLHATSKGEYDDIRHRIPEARGIFLAPNVRSLPEAPRRSDRADDGVTRLIFLGRISPVKNLDYALEVLRSVHVPVVFDIYGPLSDPDYWRACERIVAELPANVSVSWKGTIPNSSVPDTLAHYDLMFLPTRGENFGHAIFDALANGLPVLISDQTPWKAMADKNAGWSLPLSEPRRFADTIEALSRMGNEDRARLRRGARNVAATVIGESDAINRNREMFQTLLGRHAPEKAVRLGDSEAVA